MNSEPIAIIGMSCRLPRAEDPDSFWALLRDGTDAVTGVPAGRWPQPEGADSDACQRGGFLSDIEGFDAAFFGMSPNEAAAADPHQRLALELAWEALEHARIIPGELRATAAGVFIGAISTDYAALRDRLGPGGLGPHAYTGAHRAIIANRVSYFLGLRGPSLTLDTGQSSSLVAVQLACESLRRGESSLALAGGVNLNLLAETTAAIDSFGALSPDGRCRVFDGGANGYVRGEGGGLVVLKPLPAAQRDGDVVLSVILGGAVNNDGGGDGLTAPSGAAQAQVIRLACTRAGVSPADVQYVELHGTGTRVGDPVEATALGAALGAGRPGTRPLLVGSVKTNIGHLEGAAGIAGLLKVALSIARRELPASLHYTEPSPEIPLDELGLQVVAARREWPGPDQPLAGVSSFGMGGTNCHLILAAAPPAQPPGDLASPADAPWLLSARSATSLSAQAQRLAARLDETPGAGPGLVALSLARTRATFEHRAVILGGDRRAALNALAAGQPDTGTAVTGTAAGGGRVFTFPGQGSQWPGMARDLLAASPEFAALIEACAAALEPFTGYSLPDVLRGAPGAPDFDRVDVVQPALWAVMVSLAGLWRASGVEPEAVIGHSQGEIAAATVAGALSLSDGARVVALRSRAITGIPGGGGMMSVACPLREAEEAIGSVAPRARVAAVNGPRSVVVSGTLAELARLERRVTAAGYRARIVPVDYASHSPAVDQIRDEVLTALAPVRPVSSGITFISALTGQPMDTAGLDAGYWYRSLRRPVRFGLAVKTALAAGYGLFVECSPHPVLVTAVEEAIEAGEHEAAVLGTLRRGHGGQDQVRRALAEAWVHGGDVDWTGPADRPRSALIGLPGYAFARRAYPLPAPAAPGGPAAQLLPATATAPAEPAPRSRRELRELVLRTTARVLGHADAQGIPPGRTFKDLGVDSAAAIELRNRLRAATGHALPTGLIFDYPTPGHVIDRLHALSGQAQPPAASTPAISAGLDADPIAIVGIGCRYPGGVATPEDLWDLVIGGTDAITEFPVNRGWDLDALLGGEPGRPGSSDTRHGGFLHDADQFDAAFFGISPREAAAMDPQQRLMLEICWEAAERGGLDPRALRGTRTGVFVGAMAPEYGPRLHRPTDQSDGHRLTGTALSVVSGRIAYTFGLQGPAVTVDTACSSSLVAIHLAAAALRRGECELALAGGVTVMASPGIFVEFSRQHGLAADGRCKAFAAGADGTGWSEGAGVLLLERLSDARRHGRRILAVIRGSAVNQDGQSNGLTAPSGLAQERVIADALADARLTAADVHALEAHGTGTTLGDPIEAQALIATYGQGRPDGQPAWLGSVKSNIGHTQAAAGIAGVIKMAMAMRHAVLPATLHAADATPHVDWSAGQVRLLTEPVPWPAAAGPARAAISGFGVSGTNAHVIIEQVKDQDQILPNGSAPGQLPWLITARTEPALRSHAARLLDFAMTAPEADLAAAGYTLLHRARFERRAVVLAASRDELLAALASIANGTPHPRVIAGTAQDDVRPVFVFPGQGSQWAGMAAGLLDSHPGFRAELERCDEALAPHTGWSVTDVLRARDGAPPLAGSDVIQPVLFAVMVSLAAAWRAAGIEPAAVIGHSQGEIAAACVAGALTLPDAARLVARRAAALMRLTGTGGMLALPAPAEQVRDMLAPWPDRLWVAIQSGPEATVVAGDPEALAEFTAAHGERQRIHRVAIDYAAHTPHIEALRDELLAIGAGIEPRRVQPEQAGVDFCSSLTGALVEPGELTADYWYRGLRHPVLFTQAVASLAGSGAPLFIEASPHPVLTGHVQDTLRDAGAPGGAVGTLRRDAGGLEEFLKSAAQAFVLGAEVDWQAACGATPAPHVELPGYPFERRRYWLGDEPAAAEAAASGLTASPHPLLLAGAPLADTGGYLLTGRLSRGRAPWLSDHEVDNAMLLPGTAFAELALQAASQVGCNVVEELIIEAPAVLPETAALQLQLLVTGPDTAGRRGLTVHLRPASDPAAPWTRHASGTLGTAMPPASGMLTAWPPAGSDPVDLDRLYERLAAGGYRYGPAFQGLAKAWCCGDDAYVEVALPEHVRPAAGLFTLHPALLDAALHYLVLAAVEDDDPSLLLPFSWTGLHAAAPGADTLRVQITSQGDGRVSLTCHDAAGQPVATVAALTLRRVPRAASPASPAPADTGPALHTVEWTDSTAADTDLTGQPCAVIGCDPQADELAADLRTASADVGLYYDLPSLPEMTGGAIPATVVAPVGTDSGPSDVPSAIRAATAGVLDLIQTWLADDRFTGHRLVLLTQGSPLSDPHPTGTAQPGALAAAAVWGLVRSAQAEHPGRFALLDVTGDCPPETLAAALAADEPQLIVRDGTIQAPRLTPARTSGGDAEPAVAEGTVLITGGTGELGGLVARRLVQAHGAKHLLLVSRRGADAPEAAELTASLEALGAGVTVAACDVSDRAALAALLDQIPAERPLAAVIHAAGLLDDATVEGLSARHLETVLRPKADAAWHLHELTRDLPLSKFVLFSSVAGVLGTPGQGNYAAANAFLDALAVVRQQAGLPATSIAWGPWEAGLASGLTDADLARMGRAGLAPLAGDLGLDLFDAALAAAIPLVVAAHWDHGSTAPAAGHGQAAVGSAAGGRPPGPPELVPVGDLAGRLAALAQADARRLLVDLVRSHVAAVLAYPSPDAVDVDRAVSELGFDSLTAVELRNRLDAATGLRLSATLAFDHPTVTALAEHLHGVLAPPPPPPEDTLRAALDQVQQAWPEPDDITRSKITAILHRALARWETGPRDSPGVHDQIRSASDDEIFALIDNEI